MSALLHLCSLWRFVPTQQKENYMCTSASYFTSFLSGIQCRHSKTKKTPTDLEKYLKYY